MVVELSALMKLRWIFLVSMLLYSHTLYAEIVDARNINEWQQLQAQQQLNLSSWPVTRIKQLEKLRQQLQQALQSLPHHCPVILDQQLGYHSSLRLSDESHLPDSHQIEFILPSAYDVESIALVPALNPLTPFGGAYAFPKRFKLEAKIDEQSVYQEIANWLMHDFPNPGAYPVFFNQFNQPMKYVRLTVPTADVAHFALGEVYIWANDPLHNKTYNVLRDPNTQVIASGSYHQSSKWNVDYLTDATTSMGFPIHEQEVAQQDLLMVPNEQEALTPNVELIIDLGKEHDISQIDVWPAKMSHNIILPDFAFPDDIQVDVANNPAFVNADTLTPLSLGKDFGTLFSVRTALSSVRFVRIQLNQLQHSDQQRVLGIAEVAVYDANEKLIKHGKVSATGIPKRYVNDLNLLTDGYAWGRQIMPEQAWVKGLAQRRPIDQQLQDVNNELALAHSYWEWLLVRIIVGSVLVLFLLTVGAVLLYQRTQRQQLLMRQSERINRDLHDEVGSSLGSITLLADEIVADGMKNKKEDALLADDLGDLSLMAREANASLREVVRNGDSQSVMLLNLLTSLFDRADRVMRGVQINRLLPKPCPEIKVSLSVKRHITMFFKEVIHNCARHAKANTLTLKARCDNHQLQITIEDDGCGFDPSCVNNGWGLNNLKARAEELHGDMLVDTKLGKGVTVRLTIPLSMVSKELQLSYQTSN